MTVSTPRLMPMDLSRTADSYLLTADLPGVDPQSVDVDVDGRVLSIRAERAATAREGSTWLARERFSGSYLRRFTLGQSVDTAGISADYDNGVLSVVIPVTEKAKPRKVEVRTAAATAPAATEVEAEAEQADAASSEAVAA